MLFFKAYFL